MRPLDDLRRVERASVLKRGTMAGHLERRPEAVVFTYDDDYLTSGRAPVATTLPLSDGPVVTHAPGALPPFFSGLLPEGRRLTALRSALKTSADDEFSLLLAVAGDAVGDVQIVPEGSEGSPVEPRISIADWTEIRFADLLSASAGGAPVVDRVAIPGVQDKVSARMINVPVAQAGARYMLKLDPPEFPHLVANESFFLEAARHSRLEVAAAQVVRDAEGTPGLLVRRFDRQTRSEGSAQMLAQEDACQVLGRYPADKYRVSTEEVVSALSTACRARPVAALGLLRQFAFAYLTCNGDAHAKNFSIVRAPAGDEWRVSPAYDLPTSYVYGDHTMALPLNGKTRENIGRADFLELGATVGVRPKAVERALDGLCEASGSWIERLGELPFDPGIVNKLRRAIEYRRGRLGG